ncbi:MAG: hypothetical protein HC846_10890 [Blastocatellia bacterium]|nr:hypothetical protein [Blastocatellia bacterium]
MESGIGAIGIQQLVVLGVIGLGVLTAIIGWIWLVVIGFKNGGVLWGILIIFFNWLAGLIFCIMYKTGWLPLAMLILGGIIAGGTIGFFTISQVSTTMPR